MPRQNSLAKAKQEPVGAVVSLDVARKIISKSQPGAKLGWEPNPCYLCKGSGVSPLREAEDSGEWDGAECQYCDGTGWGPQQFALTSDATEILCGGAKAGGKTDAGTVFCIKGNVDELDYDAAGNPILVNQGYYHHPNYRCLVVRKNLEDLKAWISKARKMYRNIGGDYIDGEFRFPSGATIWVGHLDNADSYMKYQGIPELHRLYIEEVNQIPDEEIYFQLLSCVRSTTPGLHEQVFLTCNWIGPGLHWTRKRFVLIKDKDGIIVPPKTKIVERVTLPDGRNKELSRIFVPAGPRDNPHLSDLYIAQLKNLPPKLRRVYWDGDYMTLEGAYFEQFRAEGPLSGEPDNACHVIGPKTAAARRQRGHNPAFIVPDYPRVMPWWPRTAGGDWGYSHEAPFYKGFTHPDTQQRHVYDEMVLSKTGPEELGLQFAKWVLPELNESPDHAITLWYSKDAFHQKYEQQGIKSIVQLMMRGMAKVVGPENVRAPELRIDADMMLAQPGLDPSFMRSYAEYKQEHQGRREQGITIIMANTNRVLGGTHIIELLNWEEPTPLPGATFDEAIYRKLFTEYGVQAAASYRNSFNKRRAVYPRLQIWERCQKLIAAIPKAMGDDKNPETYAENPHFEGLDELDALRYIVLGMEETPEEIPSQELHRRAIDEYKARHPNATTGDLIWLNRQIEAEEADDGNLQGWAGRGVVGQRRAQRDANARGVWGNDWRN